MLNIIWTLLLLIGIIIACFTGNLEAVNNSILDSTQDAIELLFTMTGIIGMWNGILSIAEGLQEIHRSLRPLSNMRRVLRPLEYTLTKYHPVHPSPSVYISRSDSAHPAHCEGCILRRYTHNYGS